MTALFNSLIVMQLLLRFEAADAINFQLSNDIYKRVLFTPHIGTWKFGKYLTMELNFEPMADLFKQLLLNQRKLLANRGEAHITVITPVEYLDVLATKNVSIHEINEIAMKSDVQGSRFEIICVGRGIAILNNRTEEAYYVVVRSNDLISIREKVQNLFVSKGGNATHFIPSHFYSHITLGFTKRDLHEGDGVMKDITSCWANITMTSSGDKREISSRFLFLLAISMVVKFL